ncbi:DUF1465 family protein [Novosphingobium sp. KCTC 2891]|uniref:DUF1465 family protein n=1 Tax=Novosphingobium sp. KCTC 2891 TaxID=2989730 RepID=UPI0022233A3F|nr:DUF1465 family protein [Novosphingobium sp. KCTC 2891]MCW1382294.1 DUF1465 family protein [Novosphingobium sp. KCTC 2891]
MDLTPTLNPRIVEALYAEALVLADEVRQRFERLRSDTASAGIEDIVRVQLSCEALRTTTRVMHCLAWLLNHRAYFAGELSELQLRRHGRIIANFPASDRGALAGLPNDAHRLVHESERLYERIQRLDRAWRGLAQPGPSDSDGSAVRRLRERIAASVQRAS